MKISDVIVNLNPNPAATDAAGTGKRTPEQSVPAERTAGDTVTLSGSSRDIRLAREVAATAPEVRAETVSRLKAAIRDGSYRVNADAVAEKIMRSAFSEKV